MSPDAKWNAHAILGAGLVSVRVPAKINLVLKVGSRATDGYHSLITVFQAVGLYDEVTVTPLYDGEIKVRVQGAQASLVPTDGTDLATQAAELLRQECGLPMYGASIEIAKRIPVAGGMAGGSADAAATLLACAKLWGLNLDSHELQLLAGELGSDVPFPLLGGTAIGYNRGDELLPLMCRGSYYWALAFAEDGLSTPKVFQQFDAQPTNQGRYFRPSEVSHDLLGALINGDAKTLGKTLSNELEQAALALYPALAETLAFGRAHTEVCGGIICGSGPTCAFLCADSRAMAQLVSDLKELPQVATAIGVKSPVRGAQFVDSRLADA
ncbi:MAG: 4-(cytidine 5'-diphospho)-2-C-methyl-D-erythritol kinase [Propionibacteriaceae bacterium]|jgi:4-diphosphocytidyl-2-C-methyl-D-erythritol kinase|nr:4-(cytidine 5'-diphospho)-2-C-methyl-D-erythritol kinase [Propionibacteriaceae bacterium]